jgi:adenosine deaminase
MFEEGLAELHTHLGGSVASDIMWSLAHEQGIALPVRDYWGSPAGRGRSAWRANLDALDQIYPLTELTSRRRSRRAQRAVRRSAAPPLAANHHARVALQPMTQP